MGLSNRSPKYKKAIKLSTKDEIASHIPFTYKIVDPLRLFIRKYTTPIYPTTPNDNALTDPVFAYLSNAKSPIISTIAKKIKYHIWFIYF